VKARLLVLFILALGGCSSKKPLPPITPPAVVEAPPTISVVTNVLEAPTKFYFSDLQMLTETAAEGICPEDQKISGQYIEDWKASLNDESEIEIHTSKDFKFFNVNVTVEVMGFDAAKYSFSALDGVVPGKVPFKMRLRRTPGHVLELEFLDQIVPMKLLTTPIYTFSATEKRGSCTIKHNVNVFTEKVGYFKRAPVGEKPSPSPRAP
jgi:hypothetical protein